MATQPGPYRRRSWPASLQAAGLGQILSTENNMKAILMSAIRLCFSRNKTVKASCKEGRIPGKKKQLEILLLILSVN